MAAVCAYGEGRRDVSAKGDPPLRFVRDNIGALIDPKGRFEYLALYDMNFAAAHRREAFMARVQRAFQAW
jgi:NAD(P)H dehydrogenase (quinone)